ncbi:MAG: ATP-binding cassette domain-containing protein [Proteobacteria bacterium]|nr:ATP-binding cassette domain-containing protein [Pseudomonadota bacterium]
MSFVRLSRISFAYSSSVDIFDRVSLDLHAGWTGVVGENGSGKTTLLALIARKLMPNQGVITHHPDDALIHFCRQRVTELSDEIGEFAELWTRPAARLKARLELDPDDLERWSTLSPGQRKRWQIGAALAASPDVLLLDEPTNHLDDRARDVVVAALQRFRGVGLVVSHDRMLLEQLTTHTVRVHRGHTEVYRASYSEARDEWQSRLQERLRIHQRARDEADRMHRRLADERRKRDSAQAKISARSRIKGKKDSDARSVTARGRAMAGEARIARNVTVVRRAAERASAHLASSLDMVKERGRSLFIDYQPAPKRFLMTLDRPTLTAPGPGSRPRVLVRDIRVSVERTSRIHLAGPNGAGKTTLLRALLAHSTIDRARILYLPQTVSADAAKTILAEIRGQSRQERGRILQIAAALGLEPDRVLATSEPSPGELRKLAIARGMGLDTWMVVLDEPTNHLDLPSIERLESALIDYPGALVMVSHDQVFARAVTSTVWRLCNRHIAIETWDSAALKGEVGSRVRKSVAGVRSE